MTNRDATFFKSTGGNSGAIKIGGKWYPMPCLYCAIADYPNLIIRGKRWQGPASPAIVRVMAAGFCNNPDKIAKHRRALQLIKEANNETMASNPRNYPQPR